MGESDLLEGRVCVLFTFISPTVAHYVEILGFQYMNESMNSLYTLMLMITGIRGIGVQECNKQKQPLKHVFVY